jgi:surfactin synthase thioesterase subunit
LESSFGALSGGTINFSIHPFPGMHFLNFSKKNSVLKELKKKVSIAETNRAKSQILD